MELPLKAVLFDLDCTLIDYIGFKQAANQAAISAMQRMGLGSNEGEIHRAIEAVYAQHGIEYGLVYSDALAMLGVPLDTIEGRLILHAGITAHNKIKYEKLRPYPDVEATLRMLRTMQLLLALVTDAPTDKACERLAITGLQHEFDVIVTYEGSQTKEETPGNVDTRKPHPAPFAKAVRLLGVAPHDCLVVGDDPARDIRGGRNMGMVTCLAEYGLWNRTNWTEPHYRINRIFQLPMVVLSIIAHRELMMAGLSASREGRIAELEKEVRKLEGLEELGKLEQAELAATARDSGFMKRALREEMALLRSMDGAPTRRVQSIRTALANGYGRGGQSLRFG